MIRLARVSRRIAARAARSARSVPILGGTWLASQSLVRADGCSSMMSSVAVGPTMQPKDALRCFRDADAVFFDVDSTVLDGEGIDALAAHLGVGNAVAALTAG